MRVPLHKQDMVQVSSLLLPAVLKPETENARVDGTNRPGLELVEEGWIVSRCPTSVQNQIENAVGVCGIDVSVRAEF